MTPNANYILLIPSEEGDKTTASGIIYELKKDTSGEPTKKGVVEKVGVRVNEDMRRGQSISVGDTINYFADGGIEFNHEGREIVLVHKNAVATID